VPILTPNNPTTTHKIAKMKADFASLTSEKEAILARVGSSATQIELQVGMISSLRDTVVSLRGENDRVKVEQNKMKFQFGSRQEEINNATEATLKELHKRLGSPEFQEMTQNHQEKNKEVADMEMSGDGPQQQVHQQLQLQPPQQQPATATSTGEMASMALPAHEVFDQDQKPSATI
jgi:regulator of replication initiation timing